MYELDSHKVLSVLDKDATLISLLVVVDYLTGGSLPSNCIGARAVTDNTRLLRFPIKRLKVCAVCFVVHVSIFNCVLLLVLSIKPILDSVTLSSMIPLESLPLSFCHIRIGSRLIILALFGV